MLVGKKEEGPILTLACKILGNYSNSIVIVTRLILLSYKGYLIKLEI